MLGRHASNSIFYIIKFLAAALMTVIGPMLGQIAAEFDLSLSQSGLMYTAEFTGFAVFIVVGGVLSDRIGKRAVMTAVLAVLTVSLFAFSLADSFYFALIVMIFAGGFCGPLESVSTSIMMDLNPGESQKYILTSSVAYGLGAVFGPVVAGICLQNAVPWRSVYVGLSIVCAVMLAISYLAQIPKVHKTGGITLKAAGLIFRDWRFMLVCACIFLYCGAESSTWGWMSEYMEKGLAFTVLKSSLAIGAFWLSITVGRLICNKIAPHVPARTLVAVLASVSAVVTFVSAFVSSEMFAWVMIVLMGLFYSSQWPLMVGQVVKNHAAYSGTSIAMMACSGGIGMAVIPALLGLIAERFGHFTAQMMPAFFFVGILVLFCVVARLDKA